MDNNKTNRFNKVIDFNPFYGGWRRSCSRLKLTGSDCFNAHNVYIILVIRHMPSEYSKIMQPGKKSGQNITSTRSKTQNSVGIITSLVTYNVPSLHV